MLVDTHAHLYWESYDKDLSQVIQRSLNAGVTTVINVGVDIRLSKKALEQTTGVLANIPNFKAYSTIGIHPHESIKYSSASSTSGEPRLTSEVSQLEQIYLSDTNKVVAIGECGLDFAQNNSYNDHKYYNFHNSQIKLFQSQIDLAKKLNLPLIVHCRCDRSKNPQNSEAWDKVLEMIGDYPSILHCYSGLLPTTNYILQTTNLLVSFAGTITYPKNEYLREAAKVLPMERIVLETDCPFLPPQSKRGQRNEPSTIKEIAQLIADLKGVSLEEVAEQTTKNASEILRLRSG